MGKLHTISAALAASLLGVGAASAADLYSPPPSAPIYSPVSAYSWNGLYLGLNGGFGSGDADRPGTAVNDIGISGGFLGAQLGYNWQLPSNFVLGLEGDVQWSGIDGACGAGACGVPQSTTHDLDWFGTFRGRIGYAMGDWMPYFTAGVAFGGGDRTSSAVPGESRSNSHVGYAIGGGAEWAFRPTWTVKFEYQYISLGDEDYAFSAGPSPLPVELDAHTFRIGFNKKLY